MKNVFHLTNFVCLVIKSPETVPIIGKNCWKVMYLQKLHTQEHCQ